VVADKNTFEEVPTISNKALALLGLENRVERWDNIFTKCKGDVRPFPKGLPEEMKSNMPTKYTVSSNPDATTDKEGNDMRWSKEGIIKFNQLRQLHTPNSCPSAGCLKNVTLWSAALRPVLATRLTWWMPTTNSS
jgi:hypothetical protein